MIAALVVSLILQRPLTPAAPVDQPGTIRGRVTAADSGRPLRRASVTIRSAAEGATFRVTGSTNSLGQFEIKDVPPGPYTVSVSRSGFLSMQFGQRRANERGLTIDVGNGRTA